MELSQQSTITSGSLVRISLKIVGFGHKFTVIETDLHAYDGVESLLDLQIGSAMILPVFESQIVTMEISETRELVVRAAEVPATAKALGVNILGMLRYRIKVISVINIPKQPQEIATFFTRRAITIPQLCQVILAKKGTFQITRSYDMREAGAISEEYRIVESMLKHETNRWCLDGTLLHQNQTGSFQTQPSSALSGEDIKIQHLLPLDDPIDRIDGHSSLRWTAPVLPLRQEQALFLPDLFRTALANNSRLIVLFDAPGDWDKILTAAAASTPVAPAGTAAVAAGTVGSSDNADVAVEADVTMGIESEEADMTGSSVLTWLRIALENNSNDDNANDSDPPSNGQKNISLIDRKGHEKVVDERNSAKACPPSITITEQASSLGLEDGVNVDGTDAGEEKKKLTVINMMGGEKEAYGYRIALLRFSTWQADMAPQRRHWDGFWTLFKKAESEVRAAYGGENPSVMLVDVGAMSNRVRKGVGQRSEQGFGQEQHSELQPLPPSPPTTAWKTASQSPFPTPPSSSNSSLPPRPPTTIPSVTTTPPLPTHDLPVSWGVGDRTGMFLLVLRALALLQRIPVTSKHTRTSTNPPSSAQGQGLETSLEEVASLIVSQAQKAMAEHEMELMAEKAKASSRLADRLRAKGKGQGQGLGLALPSSGENDKSGGNNQTAELGGALEVGKAEKKVDDVRGGQSSLNLDGGGDSNGLRSGDDRDEGTVCLARELWHILMQSSSSSSSTSVHHNLPLPSPINHNIMISHAQYKFVYKILSDEARRRFGTITMTGLTNPYSDSSCPPTDADSGSSTRSVTKRSIATSVPIINIAPRFPQEKNAHASSASSSASSLPSSTNDWGISTPANVEPLLRMQQQLNI